VSNRADPSKVRTVYLDAWRADPETDERFRAGAACGCAPGHHDRDSAVVLNQLGYGIKGAVREATRRQGLEAGQLVLVLRGVRSWNLVLDDGTPRPLDATEVQLLDDATVQWLLDALDPAWEANPPLPNAPSAPSPAGSSESAGPTPTSPSPTETSPDSTST
jgi:hypothetical protein